MITNDYPRLCGGTFFVLLLEARKQRMGAREHYERNSDGLSDPEMFVALLQVINPDYEEPGKEKLKSQVNKYKACKISNCQYFPFDDGQVMQSFDSRVKNSYSSVLAAMTEFVRSFLDLGTSVGKTTSLVKALADLVMQDSTIEDTEEFFIGSKGEKIKKAAFSDLSEVFLPAFLLGVWHYAVVNRSDNTIGESTYDSWCPSNNRAPRKYTANMGNGVLGELRVIIPAEDQEKKENDVFAEDEIETRNSDRVSTVSETSFQEKFYYPPRVNREYYNIFVVGEEEFNKPFFKVPKDRALSEYMTIDTKEHFAAFDPETIEEIKTLPSLFMAENWTYNKADDAQLVIYGFVSDLRVYEDYIKVYYYPLQKNIPQRILNEYKSEFGLSGFQFNELNRTHWAIKQRNLIEELTEAGWPVPIDLDRPEH